MVARQVIAAGVVAFAAALLAAQPAAAQPVAAKASGAGRFEQGSVSITAGAGVRSSGDETSFGLTAGAGYFVADGLEVGLTGTTWIGRDPSVSQITPGVRYIAIMVPSVHPYVGAFYRRWFIGDGFDDVDTIGGRAGIVLPQTGPVALSLGVVYEEVISTCSVDCSEWYPEVGISLVF